MKNLILLCIATLTMFLWTPVQAQIDIGVQDGTSVYLPVDRNWGFSYSQQLIYQSEINTAVEITSISFYLGAVYNSSFSNDWTIYLGHTSKTEFLSNNDWVPLTDINEVYSGIVTFPEGSNEILITFDVPFNYNGTDNLVLGVHKNQEGGNTGRVFEKTEDLGTARSIYYKSGNTNPNPASPPAANGTNSFINTITLGEMNQNCPSPTAKMVNAVTSTTADISWTAHGSATQWELIYGHEGFDVEEGNAGTSIIVDDTEIILDDLDYNTAYDVYVRSICADDELSNWTNNVANFKTDCQNGNIPYFDGFEMGQTDGQQLECWTQERISGTRDWMAFDSSNHNRTPRSGERLTAIESSGKAWMFYPLELEAGITYELELYAKQTYSYGTGSIEAAFGTEDNAAEMTETVISETDPLSDSYQKYNGYIIPESSGIYFIGIKGNGPSERYVIVDDISVGIADGCFNPADPVVANVTENGADISWTAQGSANQWEVVYGFEGFDVEDEDAGISTIVNDTEITLDNLDYNTAYDVYVRSVCANDELSDWTSTSFTTAASECEVPEVTAVVMNEDNEPLDCVESSYDFYVALSITGGTGNDSYTVQDGDGEIVLSDAESGGVYMIETFIYDDTTLVYTVIGNDNDECSVEVSIDVEACCNPPEIVEVSNITEDSADITWSGGTDQAYWIVAYGEAPYVPAEDDEDVFVYGLMETTLTGLEAGTEYLVYVRTMCQETWDNLSDWTSTSFTTDGSEDCEAPDVSLSVVDANGDSMNCVEENDQYHVLIELSGGTGNDSYTVYDSSESTLESNLAPGGTYLAGPYDEGVLVSFTVEGNDDADCSLMTETVDPDVCVTEPEPCETPDVSVSVVDADGESMDCVEENGEYHVLIVLSGGSGNDTYTLYDSSESILESDLAPGDSHLAGPYDEGVSVSFSVEGNDDDECFVVTDTVDPDICVTEPSDDPYNEDAANSDVYISNIQMAGIGLAEGNPDYDFHYTSNEMSTDGYGVITDPTLTIYPGLESAYTVSSGPVGNQNQYYYSVWIDYSQDGFFDANEQIIWSAGGIVNGQIGVVDVPFTFGQFAPGTYQARIRNSMVNHPLADGAGDGESLDFTIHVITEAEAGYVLGVDNQVFTDFTYYPNPVKKQLTLQAGAPINQVEVYNLLGQKVIQVKPNTLDTNLDTDRLQSGVYLMNVTIDGNQKTFRVVKK